MQPSYGPVGLLQRVENLCFHKASPKAKNIHASASKTVFVMQDCSTTYSARHERGVFQTATTLQVDDNSAFRILVSSPLCVETMAEVDVRQQTSCLAEKYGVLSR